MLWCHMACDPNQSDFIVPIKYDFRDYSNFTQLALENVKHREKADTASESDKTFENNYDKYDYENEDKSNVEDRKKRQAEEDEHEDHKKEDQSEHEIEPSEEYEADEKNKDHTSHSHLTSKMTTSLQSNNEIENISKKPSNKREIVLTIKYFLKEEFIIQLIQSCK